MRVCDKVATAPEPVCCCSPNFVRDGIAYVGTDPGCTEHGFEAQTKARAQYIAEAEPPESCVKAKEQAATYRAHGVKAVAKKEK